MSRFTLSWQTRKRYDKSPTSKIYTTFILRGRNIFYTPRGERTTAGTNAPGAFLVIPPSGRGLVIPAFFVRFLFFFFIVMNELSVCILFEKMCAETDQDRRHRLEVLR